MSATEFMTPSMPTPPPPSRTGRTTLWIVLAALGALAVLAVGLILAAGALFVTSSSEVSSTGGTAVGPVTSVQLAPADQGTPATTIAADGSTAPASPAELLAAFGDSWQSSDWNLMQTLSNDTVVGVAKEWYVEGGKVEGIDTCSPAAGSCEFLYAPPDQTALIFTAQVETVEGRLVVSQLSFGGDAG